MEETGVSSDLNPIKHLGDEVEHRVWAGPYHRTSPVLDLTNALEAEREQTPAARIRNPAGSWKPGDWRLLAADYYPGFLKWDSQQPDCLSSDVSIHVFEFQVKVFRRENNPTFWGILGRSVFPSSGTLWKTKPLFPLVKPRTPTNIWLWNEFNRHLLLGEMTLQLSIAPALICSDGNMMSACYLILLYFDKALKLKLNVKKQIECPGFCVWKSHKMNVWSNVILFFISYKMQTLGKQLGERAGGESCFITWNVTLWEIKTKANSGLQTLTDTIFTF